jgi:uncharacterized low-complexity protein
MKNLKKSPLAGAMGAIIVSTFSVSADAEVSPFAMTEIQTPYMQLAADSSAKVSQGGCASFDSKSSSHAKTATDKAKSPEMKCGEGMCGAMMEGGKMKKGMENVCGAMMKGKEGSCGKMGGGNAKSEKSAEHTCGAMMKDSEASCGSKVDAKKAAGK